ncbi:MAG: Omp28-related outer membrane protein [Bacteroidales bacterium]|nr:Omp28-related outer membrane protein [Bacteroidales bacterium]MCF8398103.1 Omp28-related outer membrane protein [Bacteroidales bacterium]
MKYIASLIIALIFTLQLFSQDLLNEDFSGETFPPNGWLIDGHQENWIRSFRNLAGKDSPEAQLYFQPIFNDTTCLVTPALNTSRNKDIRIEFRHSIEHHNTSYRIGLALLQNNEWQELWELQPDTAISDTWITHLIPQEEINGDFQICWYFAGFSYDMFSWFVDDIRIYHPWDRDISAIKIQAQKEQFATGENVQLIGSIYNAGSLDQESCTYIINIFKGDETVFSHTDNQSIPSDSAYNIDLLTIAPTEENEIYDIRLIASADNDQYPLNDTFSSSLNTYAQPRQQVLLEEATGTWCGACPGAALGIDELLENDKQAAPIAYHILDDYENNAGLHRLAYYFIPAYPTVYFDGLIHYTGGHQFLSMYDVYLPIYEERINIKAPGELSIFGSHINIHYEITVEVNLQAQIRSDHLHLFLVLTESHIPEIWGGGGMEEVNHVERLILPDQFGQEIHNDPGKYVYNFAFDMEESWLVENSALVAFIQDTLTYEIFQAQKIKLLDLIPAENLERSAGENIRLFPNPCSNHLRIVLPETIDKWEIQVLNRNGRIIKIWTGIEEGHIIWDLRSSNGKKVQPGMYIVMIKGKQEKIVRKFISVR